MLLLPSLLLLWTAWPSVSCRAEKTIRAARSIDGAIEPRAGIDGPADDIKENRFLSATHNMFEPLECNQDPCRLGNSSWTSQPFHPENETVVIPCGLCVVMDYLESDTLDLPHGLDIQGTLTFLDGYQLTITTPFVRVQGNLEMTASNPVTDRPNVKFILTDTNDTDLLEFLPAENNEYRCTSTFLSSTPTNCNVGTKAFAVLGGRVDIRGLPPSCPTWVTLEDVMHDGIQAPQDFTRLPEWDTNHSNPKCRTLAPYMNEGFAFTHHAHAWTGGYGAFFGVTNDETFSVTGRKTPNDQGPTWDMLHVRECLIPGQDYLFSARLLVTGNDTEIGAPTTCAMTGDSCLTLESIIRTPSRTIRRRKGYDRQLQAPRYGEWHNFYAMVTYDEEELAAENLYQLLLIRGPEAGVDIEMDNVRFSLPPAHTVPDPAHVCGGNLVLNGNSESHAIHPYPISTYGGYLAVKREGDNHYFYHFGRSSNSHSVLYNFDAPGCLVANGKYTVSAKLRIHSDTPIVADVLLRSTFEGGAVRKQVLATCPGSTRGSWVVCESEVTVDPDVVVGYVRNLRIQFETTNGATLDMDVDDLRFEALDGPVSSIVVSEDTGLSQCWDEGAEILITSHTLNYDDEQVRRLKSSPKPLGDGTVRLDLDSPIVPPTTRRQSADFATEVALLSRNIVLEGERDEPLVGGHFIVFHTPTVQQHLEGVEFRNFGQQGTLGRYPVHFHMCGNVRGAVVSKNAIRESNQRCVVVHGTHNLTVSDNVAYNTSGHCFMTEDGGEVDNFFRGNLGALTIPAEELVGPSETDDEPSTFWCSNPGNEWEGNVAAGSAENGFWFELQTEVRGPTAHMPLSIGMNPRTFALKRFHNNVAHSNRRHGLRTYPSGYKPNEAAIFIGTKSYKNRNEGIFFHNSRNLVVEGGVLADNRRQADFDRADDIQLLRTSFIGVSGQYEDVVKSQSGAPFHSDMVIGLELHGFALDEGSDGAVIRDIKFSGFRDDGATPSALIHVDDEVEVGHFDYWSTLKGVEIATDVSSPWFDFGKADKVGISDIYLTDLDSSMRPPGMHASGPSTVLSNSPAMTAFLDVQNCHEVPDRAYMYCPNTCLRSIVYRVSPSETEDLVCRLWSVGNPSQFVDLTGKYHYEVLDTDDPSALDETKNTYYRKRRYFSAALPPGNYVAKFFDEHRMEAWPTFVEATVENPQCNGAMEADAVTLTVPDATEETCENLIVNGGFEMSNDDYPAWLHRDTALEVVVGGGMDGSNAIADRIHASSRGSIGQYLDTRCLQIGRQYEVRVWVKLEKSGQPVWCVKDDCPRARLRVRTPRDASGLLFDEETLDIAETFALPYREDGWMLLQGMLTVNARIANGSSVWFFVERSVRETKMFLDNVSLSIVDRSCDKIVMNGDFDNGNTTFWEKSNEDTDLETLYENGNYALRMFDRMSSSDTLLQQIRSGCFEQGSRYLATAKVRLGSMDGSPYFCDVTTSSGDTACPRMRVKSYTNLGEANETVESHDGYGVAFTDHGLTSNGWHTMTGLFVATQADEIGDLSVLSFDRVKKLKYLVLGDVSITFLPKNCNELILNGDAEYGDTPRFWRHWVNRGGARIEIITANETTQVLQVSNRRYSSDGIHQLVDSRCLEIGQQWKVSAKIKLLWNSNSTSASCNPSDRNVNRGCPPLRIVGWNMGVRKFDRKFYMLNRPTWEPGQLNAYETEFTVSSSLASCDRVSIGFRSFNLGWDLIVDAVHVTPTSSR